MMKRVFFVSTALFWLSVLGFWLASLVGETGPAVPTEPVLAPAPVPVQPRYTLQDVAAHASAGDCWMAIGGQVYDLSAYLPEHPSNPRIIEPWCGRESTDAYNTKTRNRPHSAYASELLEQYRIGRLAELTPPEP